jgi:hypothetical protein
MSHESVERVRPPLVADESTMLVAWLDWHRETLAQEVSGVDPERMREATAAPTTLTPLGLVRHMADNERYWFREVVAGEQVEDYWAPEDDPEADFRGAHPDGPEADVAVWRAAVAESRAVLTGRSMDDLCAKESPAGPGSVRWVVVHMIEEYARHNGHADVLRERLGGVVGV